MSDSRTSIRKQQVKAWALVALCAALIFAGSAQTATELDSGNGLLSVVSLWLKDALSGLFGKPVDPSPIGHFCEYFLLGLLLANALRFDGEELACVFDAQRGKRVIARVLAIAALYAVTDEFHQVFVPGRMCDPVDWAVDSCAAVVGALVFWQVARAVARRR